MQNFIKELSEYLNKSPKDEETPIIEEILSTKNITTGNENSIRWKEDDTIIEYAKEKYKNEPMYFVKDNKKTYWENNERHQDKSYFTILKVENSKIDKMEISKNDMPKNVKVNDVLKMENNEYIVDDLSTKELKEKIINMAEEILNKQDKKLENHRKVGHLY